MASLSTGVPYALTNAYTGTVKFLAIPSDSGAPQMVASSDAALPASAQWFLTATDVDPFYYLHTVATGEGKALDVINDNGTSSVRLHLVGTGRFTGQYWRFDPWSASGGEYRLSNNFTGPDRHLDVYSDTLEPHLASGDYSGQHWTLRAVASGSSGGGSNGSGNSGNGIVFPAGGTTSVGPSSAGPTASGVAVATTPAVAASSGSEDQGDSDISGGAIAGIVIGGVAALALLIGVIAFVVLGTARRKQNQTGSGGMGAQPTADHKAAMAAGEPVSPPPIYDYGGHGGMQGQLQMGYGNQAPLSELPSTLLHRGELPDRSY